MKIYLFNRTDVHTRQAFRAYYVRQNLGVVKNFSLLYFIIVLAVKTGTYFFHIDLDKIININNFSGAVYNTLFMIPAFFSLSWWLIDHYKPQKKDLFLSQLLVIAFSIYLMSRGMLNTFYAVHNPRNTMTMYMIWLMVVSIFFVFEYYETIFIAAVSFISFSILLPHYLTDSGEIFKNEFVAIVLLAIFFFTSRHIFSYRANHYIQLTTIQEKNLQIENAIHLKDEILGIVAHDLRNPLSSIESIAMLMELEDDLDEATQENLDMIKASCAKAKYIINDLIEVARNDSVDNFGVERVELNQFLEEVINSWLQSKAGSAKLVFNDTKQPVFAWINKEKMQRVMDNLISNAMKFSVDHNPIEVILKQSDTKFAVIKVKDSGLGIPGDMLPYIFDRFSKAGRKGVRGEDSVGLGLSIVRQIIRKHGGDITVESVEKQGTTFTITLPQTSVLVPAG